MDLPRSVNRFIFLFAVMLPLPRLHDPHASRVDPTSFWCVDLIPHPLGVVLRRPVRYEQVSAELLIGWTAKAVSCLIIVFDQNGHASDLTSHVHATSAHIAYHRFERYIVMAVAGEAALFYPSDVPRVSDWNRYRFFFFSNEGDPREPVHVHVRRAGHVAKFRLEPEFRLASSWGFSSADLTILEKIVTERHSDFRKAWHEHFDH